LGVEGKMPWFPDFAGAVELARVETSAEGHADPVAQYCKLLRTGDTRALDTAWPGGVTIYDPLAGVIHGHRELKHFIHSNQSWLGAYDFRTEPVATTVAGGRAVVEMLAYLSGEGQQLAWPIAVVGESPDDQSMIFRTYCRRWPIAGKHHFRPAILAPGDVHPGGIVGRYEAALGVGDEEAIIGTFEPDGYLREASSGPQYTYRGAAELRSYYDWMFSAGGGVGIEDCVVTDDGVRCALEFNCVRWGSEELSPQAGIGVFERGAGGLLAAVRFYDDIAYPGRDR
jgi:hypothetical protein